MDRSEIVQEIKKIGKRAFERLQKLNIPPYPKYYHDAFLDFVQKSDNKEVIELTKKFKYLFENTTYRVLC